MAIAVSVVEAAQMQLENERRNAELQQRLAEHRAASTQLEALKAEGGLAGATTVDLLLAWHTSQDTTFQQKVRMGLISKSLDVAGEATTVTNHTQRAALAARILQVPGQLDAYVDKASQVLASRGLTSATPDDQLLAAMDQLVDMIALLPSV